MILPVYLRIGHPKLYFIEICLHSACSPWMMKEPWANDAATAEGVKTWLRLRHQFFPYIYTMNYRCHTELSPLVQPMCYSHPKCGAAYRVPNQFWFGTELMVAPITTPDDDITHLGKVDAWLPNGEWYDFFNGMHYSGLGGRMITLCRPITSMPVFAKAGAIIPMANYTDNRLSNGEDIDVLVFPGADNTFVLYEDAGDGNDYENGAFCQTKMQLLWGAQAQFVIGPACGQRDLIPAARKWNIHLRGFHKSATVKVTVDGTVAEVFCRYAPQTNSTIVTLQASTASCICLEISGDARIHDNADWLDCCASIINAAEITYHAKEQLWDALTMSFENVHRRLAHLNFTCTDRESRRILPALKEMLTLTQEEY